MRGANQGADMLLKSAFGMMLVMFSDRRCESHFRSMRQRAFEVAPLAKAGAAAAPATTPAAAPSGEGGEADFGAPPEGFVWAEGVF